MNTQATFDFENAITDFNETYGLNTKTVTPTEALARLKAFQNMLVEEVQELQDIIDKLADDVAKSEPYVVPTNYSTKLELLTDIADFCGDVQVYCASEMARWGIPVDATLQIIMESNMSKLGADGKPIYRPEDGKVMKGPGYWKPEPQIHQLLIGISNGNLQTSTSSAPESSN